MKLSKGFMMYCSCCDSLLSFWSSSEDVEKVVCPCGNSGGSQVQIYIADNTPIHNVFKFWGNAVPVRFNMHQLWDNAHNAICGNNPFFSKEYTNHLYIYTEKSEDVEIARYDNEEDFDKYFDETPHQKEERELMEVDEDDYYEDE